MTENRASDPWLDDVVERAVSAAINPLKDDIRALKQLPANTAADRDRIKRLEKAVHGGFDHALVTKALVGLVARLIVHEFSGDPDRIFKFLTIEGGESTDTKETVHTIRDAIVDRVKELRGE